MNIESSLPVIKLIITALITDNKPAEIINTNTGITFQDTTSIEVRNMPLLGLFMVFLFSATLFAQLRLAYVKEGAGLANVEDSTRIHCKITLRLNNVTLEMVVDSFRIKYPEYCLLSANILNSNLRRDFKVENVTIVEFLKELKKVFPIRGNTDGNCLSIEVKLSSKS